MTAPVTVASYSFPHEAQLARALLDAEGILAFVADEHTINMQWLYSDALGGVKLQVPPGYVPQAKSILAQEDVSADTDDTEESCPQCQQNNVEFLVSGKRVAYFLFFLVGFPFWKISRQVRCRSCGYCEDVK